MESSGNSEQSGHHCSHGVDAEGKPKKKMCCACPETKKQRDECILKHGEESCKEFIEAHKACLRQEGFKV